MVLSQTRTVPGEVGEMELLLSSVRWRESSLLFS